MDLPVTSDLKIYRGDFYQWIDQFDDDTQTPAVPLDLSGHTWLCQIRADRDRGPLVATIDVDSSDSATGQIVRSLSETESNKLVTKGGAAVYYWDLQSKSADGKTTTWLSGKVKVRGDVSEEVTV